MKLKREPSAFPHKRKLNELLKQFSQSSLNIQHFSLVQLIESGASFRRGEFYYKLNIFHLKIRENA